MSKKLAKDGKINSKLDIIITYIYFRKHNNMKNNAASHRKLVNQELCSLMA